MNNNAQLTPTENGVRRIINTRRKVEHILRLLLEVQVETVALELDLSNKTLDASPGQLVDIILEAYKISERLSVIRTILKNS